MKYSLAIFDMDGTILDTLEDITVSTNVTLRKYGYPEHAIEKIRSFVGNGSRKLFERAVPPGTDEKKTDELVRDYLEHYNAHCDIKTAPYEGVIQLIEKLRESGVKTAVISNKGDAEVQKLCIKYFNGLFDIAVGERKGINRKPSPDAIFKILKELGIAKEKTVFIGDSETDVKTAENADMDCIAVTWGFRDVEFLKSLGVENIVSEPNEIEEYIL